MAYCPNCGTQHEGARFCPNCGTPQAGGEATAPPPSSPATGVLGTSETIWEAESKDLKHRASGGRVTAARYRLTGEALYFDEGVLSTTSEQIPLWAIRDIDVKQSLLQKRLRVGDVTVRVQHSDWTGRGSVLMKSIEEPTKIRDLINREAQRERLAYDERKRTHLYGQA